MNHATKASPTSVNPWLGSSGNMWKSLRRLVSGFRWMISPWQVAEKDVACIASKDEACKADGSLGATAAEEDEITKYDESGFTLPKQKNGSIPSFACFCLIVATLQTLMGFLLVPPDLSLTHGGAKFPEKVE